MTTETITIPGICTLTYTPIDHIYGSVETKFEDGYENVSFYNLCDLKWTVKKSNFTSYILYRYGVFHTSCKTSNKIHISVWESAKTQISNPCSLYKRGYIIDNGIIDHRWQGTCKESAISRLITCENKDFITLYIIEEFTPTQRKWLRDIQKFLPKKDRFTLNRYNKDFLSIKFPKWWFETQPLYRLGWALLAARVANAREVIEGELHERFNGFKDRTELSTGAYSCWTPAMNWRYHY